MAQLKDLIVAGSARLLGKTHFEDTVTINDTLEVDAIKADSIITPSLNSDGTNLVVGGNISLTAGGKYIEVGNGTAATNAANTGVLRVKGGLSASHHSYFDNTVTIKGGLTAQSTLAVTGAITGSSTLTVSGVAKTGNTLTIYNSSGGNTTLHFDRGTSAGWQIQDNSAILYFKCDWDPVTNKKNADGSFTNRMQIDISGNVIATGRVTSKGLTASDTVIPSANQGTTLGTSSRYWKKLYVGDGTAGAVSNAGTQTGSIIVNGGMSLTHDIAIKSEDSDKAIKFVYGKSSNNGYGWQIKYSGTGSDDANYLSIESSGTSGTYSTAVRYGLITLDAGFGGHVYPLVNNTKNLGTSSYAWKNIYGYDYYIKNNAYFANGTTYKIDSSGHAVFNNTTANGNLTVNGNTALGNATTDTTTIKGAVSITYDGTAASGSAATALSNMKGAIKVLNGGIVTNKDVAAKSFYIHDKARMQYDTTNNYVYFTFA